MFPCGWFGCSRVVRRYPIRREFDEFFKRYRVIAPGAADLDGLLAALSEKGTLPPKEFAKGSTKVFMRNMCSQNLETAREEALVVVTLKCQTTLRRFLFRKRYMAMKKTLQALKDATAARNESELEEARSSVRPSVRPSVRCGLLGVVGLVVDWRGRPVGAAPPRSILGVGRPGVCETKRSRDEDDGARSPV